MLGSLRRSTSSPRLNGVPAPVSKPPKSCFISVLGCSGPRSSNHSGVGKSALCARFIQPSSERFAQAKPQNQDSVLTWVDFVEPEINQDHFLYYGSSPRKVAEQRTAVIHVIEQTELLDEASLGQTPFPAHGKYVYRATARYLRSPGKVAFTRRSNIGVATRGKQPLPASLEDRGVSAFVLVYDPTQDDERKQQQLALLARLAEQIPKDIPAVLAVTKCDLLTDDELAQRQAEHEELARCLGGLPLIHTSAEAGINVDLVFTLLASKVMNLRSAQATHIATFQDAKRARRDKTRELERVLSGAIADMANSFDARWHPVFAVLRRMPAYKSLTQLEGREAVRKLFLARLLEIKMKELKVDRGAFPVDEKDSDSKETSDMHQALLHALDEHPDVSGDLSTTSAIYEEVEKVTHIKTWPRAHRSCDHRHTVYFPICIHSHCMANRQTHRPACHGSCPSFNERPTTLVLGEEFSWEFLNGEEEKEDVERSSKETSPSEITSQTNQSKVKSPVKKARGLLRQLLAPDRTAPPKLPLNDSAKVQTLSPSRSLPQINIVGTEILDVDELSEPPPPRSPSYSLPYLPIVIPPRPSQVIPRHQRSSSSPLHMDPVYHVLEDSKSVSTSNLAEVSMDQPVRRHRSLPLRTWYDAKPMLDVKNEQLATLV